MAAHSGRVLDPPLLMPAKVMRGGAQRAILIGSSPIKNSRISLKTHAMFFSESRYSAIHPENRQCRFEGSAPPARFARAWRTTNHESRVAGHGSRFTTPQSHFSA